MADYITTNTIDALRQTFHDAAETGNFEMLPPVHPGEILREEYLVPLDMTAGSLRRRSTFPVRASSAS